MTENRLDAERTFQRASARAVAWVLVCSLLGFAGLSVAMLQFAPQLLSDAIWIALGSVLVAVTSMVPGLGEDREDETIVRRIIVGILIRSVGTVALFLTCRYHMASPVEMIAAMTISWYVLLTLIEVVVLSRNSPGTAPLSGQYSKNSVSPVG